MFFVYQCIKLRQARSYLAWLDSVRQKKEKKLATAVCVYIC